MGRHLREDPLELDALLRETEDPSCGGLAVFTGTVRDHNDGRPVEALTYEAHAPLADRTLAEIEEEVLDRFDVRRCRIQHRVGTLAVGEASVAVVVRAPHRDAAFRACRHAIDQVKARIPVWKKEHYADGEDGYVEGTPLEGGTVDGRETA